MRVTDVRSAPSLLAARGRLEPATLRTPVFGAALEERRFDFLSGAAGAAVDDGEVAPDDDAEVGDTNAGDDDEDEDDDDELFDRCLRRFFCRRARATVEPENDGAASAFANDGELVLALAATAALDAIAVAADDLFDDDDDEREAEDYGCKG